MFLFKKSNQKEESTMTHIGTVREAIEERDKFERMYNDLANEMVEAWKVLISHKSKHQKNK